MDNDKLIKAYRDVYGASGPGTTRSDRNIITRIRNHKAYTDNKVRIMARKELAIQAAQLPEFGGENE